MLKKILKSGILTMLKLFSKEYLLEYWAIKRNEEKLINAIQKSYESFIKPGFIVFDVGANVGNYSQVFINLGAKVYAFEPQKYCINILRKRFLNNEQFILNELALGSNVSKGLIFNPNSHNIASMNKEWINSVSNSKRFGKKKWDKNEEISISTLEFQIKKFQLPDYLKIDVEGYELNVLKGLASPISFISFEITLPEMYESALDCIKEINKLGQYSFFILKSNKISDNQWVSTAEVSEKLKQLFEIKEQVSTDIFAKLN